MTERERFLVQAIEDAIVELRASECELHNVCADESPGTRAARRVLEGALFRLRCGMVAA